MALDVVAGATCRRAGASCLRVYGLRNRRPLDQHLVRKTSQHLVRHDRFVSSCSTIRIKGRGVQAGHGLTVLQLSAFRRVQR